MDESRKAFEQWVNNLLSVTISGCAEYIGGDVYKDDYHTCLWQAWKASRAAIEIELPRECNPADCFTDVMIPHEVTEAIRAAGIKVKE